MNNNYSGIKKNLDNGICVQSIRDSQITGTCNLKTCVQCQRNERKSKAVKLSENKPNASTSTNRSNNDMSQKNVRPIDIFIKWLTPEKKYVLKTLKDIKEREPETFEKMKLMSLTELSNFIFDSDNQEEQRSFNEFAIRYQKGDGVRLSQLSNREIQETISQMRSIRREIGGMTEIVVKPVSPQRAASIKLSEEFASVKSGFVQVEQELSPQNSLMPDSATSDFYKIEAARHVREKMLDKASRKKQSEQAKSREAKYEHAKFLESPEGQRQEWERRHGKEQKSSYDYEFGR